MNVFRSYVLCDPRAQPASGSEVSCFDLTQGEKFDDGCSGEDYRITVGVANCTVVDFSSNKISCEPPIDKPGVNNTWLTYCGNSSSALALMVSVLVIITCDARVHVHNSQQKL